MSKPGSRFGVQAPLLLPTVASLPTTEHEDPPTPTASNPSFYGHSTQCWWVGERGRGSGGHSVPSEPFPTPGTLEGLECE